MAEIRDLSTTDASNTARFPENQNPSTVNDGARALEGMLARAFQDTINGILETGGTGSAYTLSPNRSFTASATMPNGAEFFIRWHAACADTPTLNVDTTDARKIFWPDGTTLSASDIIANSQGRVKYNTSLSAWVLMDAPVPAKTVAAALATPDASDTDKGKIEIAVQSEMEAGSSAILAVTPGRQHFHPSAAKCWGKISVSGGTPTLDSSFNVTSIADTDTGEVTVTIATDHSDANYAILATVGLTGTSTGVRVLGTPAAGSFVLQHGNNAGGESDPSFYYFATFGDQA